MILETENRFAQGDTVYDIDGNEYRVWDGRALHSNGRSNYDLAVTGRSFMYRHEFEVLPYRLRIDRALLSLTVKPEAATLFSAAQCDETLAAARKAFPDIVLKVEARGKLFVIATDDAKVPRWIRI